MFKLTRPLYGGGIRPSQGLMACDIPSNAVPDGSGRPGVEHFVNGQGSLDDVARQLDESNDQLRRQAEEAIVDDAQTRRRCLQLIQHAAEGVFQVSADGTLLLANKALADILGFGSVEALAQEGRPILKQLTGEHDRRQDLSEQLARNGRAIHFETRIERHDEQPIWVSENLRLVPDEQGHALYYEGTLHDITERKQREEARRAMEERYALALRGASDGLWDWDLLKERIFLSHRWTQILGYEEHELSERPEEWFDRVHPDDIERLKAEIDSHLEGLTPHLENQHRLMHRDGTYHWLLCRGMAVHDGNGKPIRLAGSLTDITKQKLAEEQLLHDAFHDALTGLPNRPLITDRIGKAIWRSKRREDYLFAVLSIDLDSFKVINDGLGHLAGDRLLLAIAKRLEDGLRTNDSIARVGGDEFIILLDGLKHDHDAANVAKRLSDALAKPYRLCGQQVFTTPSIGIALSSTGYDRPEDMIRDADTAMFKAKTAGRGKFQVFDRAMHEQAIERLQLEGALRYAIDSRQFIVHYQPIVNLESGLLAGFEALVRWPHPTRGLMHPAQFIPIAEETGLIIGIGKWVLEEACEQLKQWSRKFAEHAPLMMSVNLSGRQLAQPDMIDNARRAIERSQVDATRLKLEITESVLMEHAGAAGKQLQALRELGIGLSIDDFGTGYSSLSYLHRFSLDTLKVDQSFISEIREAGQKPQVVQAIVSLAHNLDMDVVAEGVTSQAQLEAARSLGCEYGQGFYFSPPIPAIQADEMIASQPKW